MTDKRYKTYPLWLNIIAIPVLVLPLVGFMITIFSDLVGLGLYTMLIGFLGIWIFGDIAAEVGKIKK